jgi:hypothetical protein
VRTIRYRGCKGEGQSSKPKQFFLEKQRIIKLQTWESPRKNCAKKAHHKIKKKHHIAGA